MPRIIKLVLIIIIFLFGMIFHLRNNQMVVLDYFLASTEFYFSVWILATLALGAILGIASSLPIIMKLRGKNSKLLRQAKISEKEINNLRVIPVKDTN